MIFLSVIFGLSADSAFFWLSDASMPIRHGIYRTRKIMVPMRDGTELATDVYRPLTGNGSYPTILIRTTYTGFDLSQIKYFVKNQYAVAVQHVRGRNNSQGNFYSPHRYSRLDGYDTIDWIVKQKWSSGKVGTFGCSYLGENQILLAAAKHPNHLAMIANGAGGAIGKAKGSYGYFGVYENGVLNLASALGWFTAYGAIDHMPRSLPDDYEIKFMSEMKGLPVVDLAKRIVPYKTGFDDFVSHELNDKWWDKEGFINDQDTFSTAALHVNTWYDQTVHDTFRLAELMNENAVNQRAKNQHLLIDPGIHCSAGKLKEGPVQLGAMVVHYDDPDYLKIFRDWFDYWLKGIDVKLPPRFQYFLIHGDRWETSNQWPPKSVAFLRYYLQAGGRLATTIPPSFIEDHNGVRFDKIVYDPIDPVPTIGGPICCTYQSSAMQGPLDQSPLKQRDDVLIYFSDELKSDVDLIGNAKAILYVSTSAFDTDFTVKIVDEQPDGKAYNLIDGILRLRYRMGMGNAQLATPGEIYRVELELRPIAYRFKKGHKIAAYVSSSNFPRLARNLNTGKSEYKDTTAIVVENNIYRSAPYASYIELPCNTGGIE